ncbi:MAG: tRNA (adenosine(37)-N6)-threonylcarbamoyltransferase complex transferase subunit TsaD [Puniceicoccales bacterium]|nr:tRNA (adenosine(37)-N6)-threonylcarbamoyltransferase complex transferase subunit TsaD [Puniceicoccales bacterium]
MKIFAIESSCDESSLAVLDTDLREFLFEMTHSQILLHRPHGGVVPDLAARAHLAAFPPLLSEWREKNFDNPDLIAVTRGPGLAGCLAAGFSFAWSLALFFECPIIGVNHLRGHALSPFMRHWQREISSDTLLPHLGLLVSGGNTLLFFIKKDCQMVILGRTSDDAAGEALDKGAKLLSLHYPGGVEIERLALFGDPGAFQFPRAFRGCDLKFSFSGVKTALLYQLRKMPAEEINSRRADLCASYQEAICDALVDKVAFAVQNFPCRSLGLSGGVSQNGRLRAKMQQLAERYEVPLLLAPKEYCGDNASMIAFAAAIDPQVVPSPEDFHADLELTQ